MVQLLAYDNDNSRWVNLDLQEELTISLNKSIEEVEDITQRKTSYTKTFTIPSTDKNETFFRSAFNVNATDFNNKLQTTCLLQDNGNDLFRGKMRLNKVIVDPEGTLYEVYLIEEVAPFAADLKNFSLCDLDFSDAQHEVTYDNIVSTWEFTGGSYTNYSGIVGNVLYPMTFNGYNADLSYGKLNLDSDGFTNPSNPMLVEQFKPWLNLKYMVDLIFENSNYRYTSEFFNTDYFESIYVLAGNNDGMGAALLGERPDNQNLFLVQYEGISYFYDANINNLAEWNHIVYNTIDYDYLNQYTESGFPATGPGTGQNFFTVPISGDYQFLIKQDIFLQGTVYAATYIDVAIRDIDTGTVEVIQSGLAIPPGNAKTYTFYLNATLTKGQRVAVMFRRQTTGGDPYNRIGFRQGDEATFELYSSPDVVVNLGDIKWGDNLPCDVTGLDFIRDVIGVFNLVVIPNGEREFIIEPYTNYLSSDSGTTYDWSAKLDYSQTYEITPLDFDLQRELHITYTQAEDQLNDYFDTQFNEIFGEKFFVKQSELLTGSQQLQFGFEPLPSDAIAQDCTMVLPSLSKLGEPNTDPRQIPMSNGLRLGFYCGKQHFYTGTTNADLADYYILSGTSSQAHNTYPLINHLSLLQEPNIVNNVFSDLNFDPTYDFFQSKTDFIAYTPNTTYNYWYKPYLNLLYSDEARLFKGNFILTPEEVSKLNFNDSVSFLNSKWRLYSVNDADITQKSSVECEFLKEPFRGGKIEGVAPNYTAQNTPRPTPTPIPTNTLYWYVENKLGAFASNIVNIDFEVWQNTTQYLNQTAVGSGTVGIPSGTNYYAFTITYQPNAGSLNNLRITLGPSSGDGSYAQLDIPQPITNGVYFIQADVYFPASGNVYATIDTY